MFILCLQPCFALTSEEIQKFQTLLVSKPIGERIAFWAERFVGVPYDTDPLGEYVSKATIVSDKRIDCMYLTFRTVELALSHTPEEAIQVALERRFHSKGVLKDGHVINYDDRFEYGEDMIESGKWGKDMTSAVGKMMKIKGSRGKDFVEILSSDALVKGMKSLKSGDLVFFAKKPEKREVGEIIGHMGILKVEESPRGERGRKVYLIHASGMKEKGGAVHPVRNSSGASNPVGIILKSNSAAAGQRGIISNGVKKVLLKEYLSKMSFIGVKITRFQ
jgi:hypothetical protein